MKIIAILPVFVSLFACDSQSNDPASDVELKTPSLIEPQLDALDRAGAVEGMLDDAVKKREEEMKERGI